MNAVSPLTPSSSTTRPAQRLRVAFFSDSVAERNGAGTYYHDLLPQLNAVTAGVKMFQPSDRPRSRRLSIPMPGDPTPRLLTPNIPKLWREFSAFRPDVVVSITPGPFGLLGNALARRHGCGQLVGFHTQFEELSRLYWNPLSRSIANRYLTVANRVICRSAYATVVNNRADRIPRSQVFARMLASEVKADRHFLIGSNLDGLSSYIEESWNHRLELMEISEMSPESLQTAVKTLAQQLEICRSYLELMRLRLGQRMDYQIEAPPDHLERLGLN